MQRFSGVHLTDFPAQPKWSLTFFGWKQNRENRT